jgi:hypothetical protein
MASSNRHGSHKEKNTSATYTQELLGPRGKCPRKQCKGRLVPVLSQYKKQGPINQEFECTDCEKIIRDPRFKAEREERWKNRKQSSNKPYRKPNANR